MNKPASRTLSHTLSSSQSSSRLKSRGLERSKKYKYTRLSDESKLALQRPVLQILSNFHKLNAIKKTKAFLIWKNVGLRVGNFDGKNIAIKEDFNSNKNSEVVMTPEITVPEPTQGVAISVLHSYFKGRISVEINKDNEILLFKTFSTWKHTIFTSYKKKTSHMKSHMFWTGLLHLERAVLRRAFLKVRNFSLLDVGIANEMRAYLENALNSDSGERNCV
ncbi:hypothetical protein TrLO_g11315 [Triparma laevis f. longispina]|uniref:Uncharacterized protein n=1 Tax=Triparma laevis f. longispina TaxID=1714387 RepID=A0A9W6ZTE1_9STRA|nr:hypothetical protein TrLO_g11315 [Triparma laevis f. longispina]